MANEMTGLPTAAQVTEQMEQHPYMRGALYLVRDKHGVRILVLGVVGDAVVMHGDGPYPADDAVCAPCDKHGNPLPLIDALRHVREERDKADIEVERLRFERNTYRARLSQAARRVLELGRESARYRRRVRDEFIRAELAARRAFDLDQECKQLAGQAQDAERERDAAKRAHDEVSSAFLRTKAERNEALAIAERDRYQAKQERARLVDAQIYALNMERERDHLRDVNEKHTERIRSMEARIGGLESELAASVCARDTESARAAHKEYERLNADRECARQSEANGRLRAEVNDLLGDEDTPEGKALRALVLAARRGLGRYEARDWAKEDDVIRANISIGARDEVDDDTAADVAVLLARREQESTTLGDTLDASWAAHAKVETCGECRWRQPCDECVDDHCGASFCFHPARDRHPVVGSDEMPDDCPGSEPRDVG